MIQFLTNFALISSLTLALSHCTKNENSMKTTETRTQEHNNAQTSTQTLAEKLKAKADQSASQTPAETKKIMFQAIEDLRNSEVMKTALKKGSKMPSFELPDVQKGQVSSSELLQKGPLLVVFYRGGWCPYCNLQLRDLQTHLEDIRSTGATLVAISPETPDSTAETVKKDQLDYYVLSDSGGITGKKFGLMFQLPEDLKQVYKKFGIDLEESNGNNQWELPLGATYIVNSQGEIIYSFVEADYKKRAETTELIKILKEISS